MTRWPAERRFAVLGDITQACCQGSQSWPVSSRPWPKIHCPAVGHFTAIDNASQGCCESSQSWSFCSSIRCKLSLASRHISLSGWGHQPGLLAKQQGLPNERPEVPPRRWAPIASTPRMQHCSHCQKPVSRQAVRKVCGMQLVLALDPSSQQSEPCPRSSHRAHGPCCSSSQNGACCAVKQAHDAITAWPEDSTLHSVPLQSAHRLLKFHPQHV